MSHIRRPLAYRYRGIGIGIGGSRGICGRPGSTGGAGGGPGFGISRCVPSLTSTVITDPGMAEPFGVVAVTVPLAADPGVVTVDT